MVSCDIGDKGFRGDCGVVLREGEGVWSLEGGRYAATLLIYHC